jgi:hypothetical protein
VPRHIVEADLRQLFQPFGTIVELTVLRDKMTQAHRSDKRAQRANSPLVGFC